MMIKLEIKNYDMILIEKLEKYQPYHQANLRVMSRVVAFLSWLPLHFSVIIASILSQQCNQKTFTIFFLKKDY